MTNLLQLLHFFAKAFSVVHQKVMVVAMKSACHAIKLKLEMLDVRRLRFDILFVYKMLFNLVWLDFPMFFALSPVDNTRGHCYKLLLPSCNTDIRKYLSWFVLSKSGKNSPHLLTLLVPEVLVIPSIQ